MIKIAHDKDAAFTRALVPFGPLQPSSPGEYYSSVETDLKVELTEKLFALDTDDTNSSANTEVEPSLKITI